MVGKIYIFKCTLKYNITLDTGSCNHDRAPRYYAESIKYPNGFWSFSCPSWMHYMFGMCSQDFEETPMGYHVNNR